MKPEDWLVDYSTAVSIANGNKRVAVKYVPLMLQGTARSWLNSLKPPLLGKGLLMAHQFCLLMAHYWCAISIMPLVFLTNGAPLVY